MLEVHPFGLEVTPEHPCDRCDHALRRHGPPETGSKCERKPCLCDGYVTTGAVAFVAKERSA